MRRIIVWAGVVGLAARLAFGLSYWVDKPLTHDEQEYLALAQSLAQGRGLTYDDDGREHFGRAPLYPLFLAGVARLAPGLPAIKVAQAALGVVLIVLVSRLAGRAAGPQAAGAAAILTALYPPLVWIPAYVLSETLYSVLMIGAALLVWRALDHGSNGWAMLAGGLSAAAALTRPAGLVFVALAGLALLRVRMTLAIMFLVAVALAIAPWTARNMHRYGRFVLIASEGGITFWTGNHPLARGEGDLASNPALKRANNDLRARYPHATPEELEPIYYREALRYIASDPAGWVLLLLRKFVYLWIPVGPSFMAHSSRYFVASVISYGLLLLGAVPGCLMLLRRAGSVIPLWILAGSAIIVCLAFFPQERFRIPVLDPVMIVCAATAIAMPRLRS